jgi:hypothetical protein
LSLAAETSFARSFSLRTPPIASLHHVTDPSRIILHERTNRRQVVRFRSSPTGLEKHNWNQTRAAAFLNITRASDRQHS